MINQEQLKELLHYDPETGIFTWRKRDRKYFKSNHYFNIWNDQFSGKKTGSMNGGGYLRTSVLGRRYKTHRLAFLYMTGEFPPDHTDHINGIRDDNRWVNLRAVSHAENGKNQRLKSNNNSGFNGVFWREDTRKWRVFISVNGKRKHLGQFIDKFEAVCCRKAAEIRYKYHPNHGIKF